MRDFGGVVAYVAMTTPRKQTALQRLPRRRSSSDKDDSLRSAACRRPSGCPGKWVQCESSLHRSATPHTVLPIKTHIDYIGRRLFQNIPRESAEMCDL